MKPPSEVLIIPLKCFMDTLLLRKVSGHTEALLLLPDFIPKSII